MNRKELISKLDKIDKTKLIRVIYHGLHVSIDRVESYRGSYDSISLSIDESEINNNYTVGDLIMELRKVTTLYGFKGGIYNVNELAHVYVSPYGYASSRFIDGVLLRDGVCLLTSCEELWEDK